MGGVKRIVRPGKGCTFVGGGLCKGHVRGKESLKMKGREKAGEIRETTKRDEKEKIL